MDHFFTILSLAVFFAFIGYLVYDALHAPEVPPAEDPDYYPTYPLDPRD